MSRPEPPSPQDRAFLTKHPDRGNLILVRHGQQEWPDRTSSSARDWINPPLSALGRRQATAVGLYLAPESVDAVYSSHLLRAHDTGIAISSQHKLEVEVLSDLAEVGIFEQIPEGKRASDIIGEKALLGVQERFVQTKRWDAYPHSETSTDFRRRVGFAIEGILASHQGETVVVACHGGVINAYLSELLGIAADMFFRPSHASVHRLTFADGHRIVERLNEDLFLVEQGIRTQ